LSTLDLITILLGFQLANKVNIKSVPLPDDERLDVNSMHYLLGEGLLFPLSETPIVKIPQELLDFESDRVARAQVS
jgi:hypothetical protein